MSVIAQISTDPALMMARATSGKLRVGSQAGLVATIVSTTPMVKASHLRRLNFRLWGLHSKATPTASPAAAAAVQLTTPT